MEILKALPMHKRWQQQRYPVAAVVAIISRVIGGLEKYLLIQRRKEPYTGIWALPGGRWEFGESLAEAVIREVNEETGLQPEFSGLCAIVNCQFVPSAQKDPAGHFLLFVCNVTAPVGSAQEQKEGSVAWFSTLELDKMRATGLMVPTDYLMLEKYRQRAAAIPYVEAEVIGTDEGVVIEVARFEEKL